LYFYTYIYIYMVHQLCYCINNNSNNVYYNHSPDWCKRSTNRRMSLDQHWVYSAKTSRQGWGKSHPGVLEHQALWTVCVVSCEQPTTNTRLHLSILRQYERRWSIFIHQHAAWV